MKNYSVWNKHLKNRFSCQPLKASLETDVLVIGGGISGIITAYFLLKNTEKNVVILEKGEIGQGATGHNAGMMVSSVEAEFEELLESFGIETLRNSINEIESGWDLFDQILVDIPTLSEIFQPLKSQCAIKDVNLFVRYIHKSYIRKKVGINLDRKYYLVNDEELISKIPIHLKDEYQLISYEKFQEVCETEETGFVGYTEVGRYGLMSSLQFTHTLLKEMTERYGSRILAFEKSGVEEVGVNSAFVKSFKVEFENCVFCTNGYKFPKAKGFSTPEIITKVDIMGSFEAEDRLSPKALSYVQNESDEDYIYLSRRKLDGKNVHAFGGSESFEIDLDEYNLEEIEERKMTPINSEAKKIYKHYKSPEHFWQGAMGYTSNYLRIISQDKICRSIYYNLGCNGIGIIPGIYGGWKISKLISGKKFTKSIFDIV